MKTITELNKKQSSTIRSVFNVGDFTAYFAETSDQLNKAYALRYQVYCDELNWVPLNDFRLEYDEFDSNAKIICVENEIGDLVGTMRVISGDDPWMLDKNFSETVAGDLTEIKGSGCVEASRNTIALPMRNKLIPNSELTILEVLLVMAMDCATDMFGKQSIIVTATPAMGAFIRRSGAAIRQIGRIVTMDDGCKVASYQVDIEVSKDTAQAYVQFHKETRGYAKAG